MNNFKRILVYIFRSRLVQQTEHGWAILLAPTLGSLIDAAREEEAGKPRGFPDEGSVQ